jgi:phenylalanyl-tRNA synthetase beta chain
MRIPYEWLKDYVDVTLAPDELAHELTMHGLEVERVEYPWPGIVTAQIVRLERIKGSDHLSATRVTTGSEELSVVCGAPNIKLHDKVPLAHLGARVGEITIGEKKTMGVVSQGMLCSPRELGLSDDHAGIYILPKDTPLGVPLGHVLGVDNAVIDLDIKAHRGDLFSMVGVAREVVAFTGQSLRPPRVTVKEAGTPAAQLMKLEVQDAELCPRYTARVVRGVTIGRSPEWMQRRLLAAGMRPINTVVDITNYVMLELGQPLHAFDYAKVADHTIVVRHAYPGDQLTTLDGVARQLTSEMLLITDPAGPTVVAGIFGGARVEVSDVTTDVILEAAHFNPTNVRRTSQALGLRTESSGRFEKNPDIALTALAIDRAAQLIMQLAGGTIAPGRLDFYPAPVRERELVFHLDQVPWLTGMQVTPTEAVDALCRLGFGVLERASHTGDVVLDVTVPTWRNDIEESADLVEEVARIVGYERIPSTIPTGPLPAAYRNVWYEREDALRDILVGAGLTEIVSYTLTTRAAMATLLPNSAPGAETLLGAPVPVPSLTAGRMPPSLPGKEVRGLGESGQGVRSLAERLPAIVLTNPPSSEQEALRLTLMSGLLATLRENAKHERAGMWLFEIGRRYLPTPELARGRGLANERRTLGVALTGPVAASWTEPEREADFFDLKGIAELLLRTLKAPGYRFLPAAHPTFHPGRCAALEVAALAEASAVEASDPAHPGLRARVVGESATWVPVGVLGEVHPAVAEQFEVPARTYLMEFDLERLYAGVPARTLHAAILRYPAAMRDLALLVDTAVPAAEVEAAIRASGGPLLRDVRLFDVYIGEGVPAGKRSLAYTLTYQSSERTLTDAEIEAAQRAVVAVLAERLGATLRT